MTTIARLTSLDDATLSALTALLHNAVQHGASVHFLAETPLAALRAFWVAQATAIEAGDTQLFVATQGDALIGCVLLMLKTPPNAPHRAEIGKMLVHARCRRQGIGRTLLAHAEQAARDLERSLLLLDTEAHSPGDRLYAACGWTRYGLIPGHALRPDGTPGATACFYKTLSPSVEQGGH